jgi:hypothetical protein
MNVRVVSQPGWEGLVLVDCLARDLGVYYLYYIVTKFICQMRPGS